jgi:CheY-like chemotaxis protein
LAALEERRFDLIITDYSMPGMKGDELAAQIKQRWPDQRIIMVTGSTDQFNSYGTPPSGVDVVINKPFSRLELRAAIDRELAAKIGQSDGVNAYSA